MRGVGFRTSVIPVKVAAAARFENNIVTRPAATYMHRPIGITAFV